eukprot:maker-scaffold142_size315517-snap-gene-0.17 protein:Tk07694 transcript:maker-scaffold142_size315517-snap-gene-0.17-mRNA-1 annotation:"rna exonuclease nef-sp-like isoform x4"
MVSVSMEASKRDRRVAAKKRKIAAFLTLAETNDQDEVIQSHRKRQKLPPAPSKPAVPAPLTDKPLVEGDDLQELRRRLRERKKYLLTLPHFDLKSLGQDASLELPLNMRTPLLMSDLHKLVTYSMLGNKSPCEPLRWCKMMKWNKLTHVNCLFIDGVSAQDFLDHRDTDPGCSISGLFPHKLEFVSPAAYDSTMASEMMILSVSQRRRAALMRSHKSLSKIIASGEAFKFYRAVFPVQEETEEEKVTEEAPTSPGTERERLKLKLLLSAEQMLSENYPLPLPGLMSAKLQTYVLSKDSYKEVHCQSPVFSVDCEMCLTREGSELTRICVVNSELEVVYHSLVKPHNEIRNYLTRYSGITPAMLVDVETRLVDVQNALRDLLPPDAIWVGQSLNSDLHALKMMHPYVIDTSVIFNITGQRPRKTKLSVLSALFLGQSIQNQGKHGHNPIEDAQAAMKLVNLKLDNDFSFGDAVLGGTMPHLDVDAAKEAEENDKKQTLGMSLLDQAKKEERNIKIVVQSNIAQEYMAVDANESHIEQAPSLKSTLKLACDSALANNLTLCHIRAPQGDDMWKKVQKATKKLWRHTSVNGMFITVLTGSVDENAFVGVAMNRPKG